MEKLTKKQLKEELKKRFSLESFLEKDAESIRRERELNNVVPKLVEKALDNPTGTFQIVTDNHTAILQRIEESLISVKDDVADMKEKKKKEDKEDSGSRRPGDRYRGIWDGPIPEYFRKRKAGLSRTQALFDTLTDEYGEDERRSKKGKGRRGRGRKTTPTAKPKAKPTTVGKPKGVMDGPVSDYMNRRKAGVSRTQSILDIMRKKESIIPNIPTPDIPTSTPKSGGFFSSLKNVAGSVLGGLAPAIAPASVLAGGAALTYGVTEMAKGEQGKQMAELIRKETNETGFSMLGAMDPDAAMGYSILNPEYAGATPEETEANRKKYIAQQEAEQAKLKDAPWYTRLYGIGKEDYLKGKNETKAATPSAKPVDLENSADVVNDIAQKMGLPAGSHRAERVGGVPIKIDGVDVPENLLTEEQKSKIRMARDSRTMVSQNILPPPAENRTIPNDGKIVTADSLEAFGNMIDQRLAANQDASSSGKQGVSTPMVTQPNVPSFVAPAIPTALGVVAMRAQGLADVYPHPMSGPTMQQGDRGGETVFQ